MDSADRLNQLFDVLKAGPLARLGYHQYTYINNVFEMRMPMMPDDYASAGVLSGDSGDPESQTDPKKVGDMVVANGV